MDSRGDASVLRRKDVGGDGARPDRTSRCSDFGRRPQFGSHWRAGPRVGAWGCLFTIAIMGTGSTSRLVFRTLFEGQIVGVPTLSRKMLLELPRLANCDDFVFDSEKLGKHIHAGFRVGEMSCPPRKYVPEAFYINVRRSATYGLGVVATTVKLAPQKRGLRGLPSFQHTR